MWGWRWLGGRGRALPTAAWMTVLGRFEPSRGCRARFPSWHQANCQGKNYSPRDSQNASAAQFPHPGLGHAEPAKYLGVVLAELRGDGAHPHTVAEFDWGADVRDLAQFRVARVLHEAAVAHLRVGKQLRVIMIGPQGAAAASSRPTQCSVVSVVSTASIASYPRYARDLPLPKPVKESFWLRNRLEAGECRLNPQSTEARA